VLNFFLEALFDLTRVVFLAFLLPGALRFALTLAIGVDDAARVFELAAGTLECLTSGTDGDGGTDGGTGAAA
jgi:hypothetical protein